MVLKERESWKSDRQQLLHEKRKLQRKLSVTEKDNMTLKNDLLSEKEKAGQRDKEMSSLNHSLSNLKQSMRIPEKEHPVETHLSCLLCG